MADDDAVVGVALSGGGHRATLWSFGALLAMVDAGTAPRIDTITSVSGGSFAHGVVAQDVDLASATHDDAERAFSPMVRMIAHDGLFLWGPATRTYAVLDFTLMGVGAVGVLVGLAGLLWSHAATAWVAVTLVAAALLAAGLWWAEQRGRAVDRALGRLFFSRSGRRTRLAELDTSVDHVFCATELQSGEFFYLRPSGLVSWAFGTAPAGTMELATVVQVSACVPGGFPPHELDPRALGFTRPWPAPRVPPSPSRAVLVDGGVYDNMAEEWFARRRDRAPLAEGGTRAAIDEVVVVNASARDPWVPYRGTWIPGLRELREVLRSQAVTYDAVGSGRRHADVAAWTRAGTAQRGALVHIAQSPVTVARAALRAPVPPVPPGPWPDEATRVRAARALEWLGVGADDDPFAQLVDSDLRVPTTLSKLGVETSVDLLEHSYLLTAANLHVVLGHPLPGSHRPSRERFRALVDPAGAGGR
ncbi:MAG: patatin-like phospholipase family protein [Candidatus Nanopelagicales bacterium]